MPASHPINHMKRHVLGFIWFDMTPVLYRTGILTPKSKQNHLATWEGDDRGLNFWPRVIPKLPTPDYNQKVQPSINGEQPLTVC